ncbi:MAG: hypothetical protein Tsb0019_09700 [Roseibium sp.]
MIRIGLVDGALPADWPGLDRQGRFCAAGGADFAGRHAAAMARTIARHAPSVRVSNAVVFPGRLSTSLDIVCAALAWLAEDPPDIVLCAFGTPRSSPELAVAVARLQKDGAIVVASSPARGEAVYPAAFRGVVSVQGDARCASGELSRLDLPHAVFGACPVAAGAPDIRGASPAAAHLAGLLAAEKRASRSSGLSSLEAHVRYHGREMRSAQGG